MPRPLLAGIARPRRLRSRRCGGGGSAAATRRAAAGRRAQEPRRRAGLRTTPAEIEALLRDRARALEQGDVAAFAGTATGDQRGRDRRAAAADGAALARARAPGPRAARHLGDRGRIAVAMSYRVRGMNRPFLTLRRVSARKTSAGWRISGDVARREPLPWEVASFKATRVPHVVLLTPPGVDVAPLRSGLARAYREIRRDLPERDLPRSVLVIGSARRCPGRAADGPHRTRRRRARQRLGQVRPGPGARGRARARAADAGDRLALERAARVRAPFDAGARDDAHGAGPGHVRAHAAVARGGGGDVRLRRRPRRRGAAARRGRRRELEAARAVPAELDLQADGKAPGRGVRRQLGRGGGDRGARTARAGCSGSTTPSTIPTFTGRRAPRRPIACCAARWACRSPSSRRRSPRAVS